jgi:hypothetical protein
MPMTLLALATRLRNLQRHEVEATVYALCDCCSPMAELKVTPDADGDWVRWEDVAALLAEVN